MERTGRQRDFRTEYVVVKQHRFEPLVDPGLLRAIVATHLIDRPECQYEAT